ncbi:MAG: integrase [Desulforhopalus sp.]|jgi:integrase
MGTVRKRKRKSGTKYLAEIHVNGHRESKTFDDDLDARIWIRKRESEIRTGVYPDDEVAPGDLLLTKAIDRFIVEARSIVSRAQVNNYGFAQVALEKSFPATIKLSQLNRQDVSNHILTRMTVDGVGPSSIRSELSLIRKVYEKAIEWGMDYPSPELGITRPKHKTKSREDRLEKVLKVDELNSIFEEAANRRNNLYYFLRFLLFTGMRPSEAAHLYWEQLPRTTEKEAIKNRFHVGYVDLKRGGFSKVGTKTETRFVPAHPEAIAIIEKLRLTKKEGQKLVFLDNKHINRETPYKHYRRTLQTTLTKATVDKKGIKKNINFYSFRHTTRSNFANCGIPTETGETIIGHNEKSFKFTYIHLTDEHLISEIKKLHYPGLEKLI